MKVYVIFNITQCCDAGEVLAVYKNRDEAELDLDRILRLKYSYDEEDIIEAKRSIEIDEWEVD